MYQFQDPMRVNIPVYPSMNGGILSNPLGMGMNMPPPILTAPNSRSEAPLALPSQRIGTNEMLMRVGGQIMGGAAEGGLNAMEKGTEEFGRIQDLNRSNALREYNAKVMGQYRDALAKKATAAANKKTRKKQPSPYNAVVIEDLDRALSMLEKGHNWNEQTQKFERDYDFRDNVTGFAAETIGQMFAGTKAADFAQLSDTIKSNIGFDRLQKMRDDSPTGGALGQVSEMELRLLNAALGSLAQTQSPEQLRENLLRIKRHYVSAVEALRAEYAEAGIDLEEVMGQPMPSQGQQQPNSSFDEADSIVGIK